MPADGDKMPGNSRFVRGTLEMRRLIPLFALLTVVFATPTAAADTLQYDPTVCADHTDGSALSDDCLTMIETYPVPPAVEAVEQYGYTLDTFSFWRAGPDPIPTFDVPSGNPNGEIAQGFNFVRAIDLSVD